ncbi:adenine deaminase [Patescibacteria group bacterium]
MDLLLKNANIVDCLKAKSSISDIAISKGFIKLIKKNIPRGNAQVIDLSGKYVSPGFIDGHIHIESSLLSPPEFAKLAIRNGTTCVVADPHEIVNVAGADGFKYMLESSKNLPIDFFFMAPSCVPSTNFETAGGMFGLTQIKKALKNSRVLGLAEMMNYPGVIHKDPDVISKITAAQSLDKIIDGHAPGLTGKDLDKYIQAGITSDHECSTLKEAIEKLNKGMWIMIREGSAARNLNALYPIITTHSADKLMLVTDDKHADEMVSTGHLNATIKKAIKLGVDPYMALRLVTFNPAKYFKLQNRGEINAGYIADLVIFDNLENINVLGTIKDGKIVYANKDLEVNAQKLRIHSATNKLSKSITNSVSLPKLSLSSFQVKTPKGYNKKIINCKVIGVIDKEIVTKKLQHNLQVDSGMVQNNITKDIIKIAVVERHGKNGNIGLGFVKGFGMKNGTLATTIAHDSHNLIIVGTNDKDMLIAAKHIDKTHGGMAIVQNGKVLASVRLDIAGLMYSGSSNDLISKLDVLNKVIKEKLKTKLTSPFMTLSFLSLPVIPELKITDKGLFESSTFSICNLFN